MNNNPTIQQDVDQASDSLNNKSPYNWIITLVLCVFLGLIRAHRFYAKKTGTGLLMLITLGLSGIWVFIDLILILTGKFKDENDLRLESYVDKT